MICVVTVTYGDRACLLEQVITRVLNLIGTEYISKVVVVDNGSSFRTKAYLANLQLCEPRASVVHLDQNEGSAGGFRAGLEAALQTGSTYLWLLDDDNVPEPSALAALLERIRLNLGAGAFLSLRTDRPQYVAYAHGAAVADCFMLPNGFIGFSVSNKVRKLLKRTHPKLAQAEPRIVPYGPYGGLLVKSADIRRVGLPNPDLFVYSDDSDLTYRFTRAGIPIELVPDSRITDVDRSWSATVDTEDVHFFVAHVLLTADQDTRNRLYYTVRNEVAFSKQYHTKRLEFLLNAAIYLFLLSCLSLSAFVLKHKKAPLLSFSDVLRGVYDGSRGKFGKLD